MNKGTLRDFNAYIGADSYLGRVTSYTPPDFATTVADYRAGGLSGPIPIDMGLEALEASLEFGGFEPEALKRVGMPSEDTTLTLRGALIGQGEPVKQVVHTLTGKATASNFGVWTPGESAAHTITLRPHYFRVDHEGSKILEIDFLNDVRFTNGEDQMEAIRRAIGR